jgi:prepilin-type N-terminal cleavage/methylation domain-containing protein
MLKFWKPAFTLVELIVVITIIWILSTVGFVSYSGYLLGARDSNRISQMVKIGDALQVYSTRKSLPLPDDYIEVNASWSVIGYQGEVGSDTLETIDYTNGGKDPKDEEYFSYFLNSNRKLFQLMAMMEEQSNATSLSTNMTYAVDYENRYPRVYGKKLWILIQAITNIPIHKLKTLVWDAFDIVNEAWEYTSYISNNESITGSGAVLLAMNPNYSCDRIKQSWWAQWSGNYTINPDGTWGVVVFCDFENLNPSTWGTYSFPDVTVAENSTQTKVRSSYIDIVNTYPWFNYNEDIPFTLSGQGNPTVSVNGTLTRASSGVLRDGTNIEVDTPPPGISYTATVSFQWYDISFTAIGESSSATTLDMDFGTMTVNYSGRITSTYKNFPSLTTSTPITVSWAWTPTAQLEWGGRGSSWNITYGTNIEADAPASGQTSVINVTIDGQSGTFTIIRQ